MYYKLSRYLYHIGFVIVLVLISGCKVNNATDPDDNDPISVKYDVDSIANYFSAGDADTHKRTIIESDGISKLYQVTSIDEWSVESVFKDTSEKIVLVNFTIQRTEEIEYLNCTKISFDECVSDKETNSGSSEASYMFDLNKNRIEVNIRSGILSSAGLSGTLIPTNMNIRFDYNFEAADTSSIIANTNDPEYSLISKFIPARFLQELNFSSGDDCMFYKASISDQFDDFDITELSSCNSIDQIKQDLYHFFPFSTGEQFNFERTIGFSSTYYEEEIWNQKSREIWKIEDDTFSESTLIRTIEFESTSLDSIDYEYWDPDTSIHTVVLDTTIYYSTLILNYKERALKLDFPNEQFRKGPYSRNRDIPDSLNIKFNYDFKIGEPDSLVKWSHYNEYADQSLITVVPGMGLKNILVYIVIGTPHSQTRWYFSLINKTEN